MTMSVLTLYTRRGCHLCEEALAAIERLRREISFELVKCDLDADEALHRAYFERIPVIELDGVELCEHVVDEQDLRDALIDAAQANRGSRRQGHPLESRRWPTAS